MLDDGNTLMKWSLGMQRMIACDLPAYHNPAGTSQHWLLKPTSHGSCCGLALFAHSLQPGNLATCFATMQPIV